MPRIRGSIFFAYRLIQNGYMRGNDKSLSKVKPTRHVHNQENNYHSHSSEWLFLWGLQVERL